MNEREFLKGEIKKAVDKLQNEEFLRMIYSLADKMRRQEATK